MGRGRHRDEGSDSTHAQTKNDPAEEMAKHFEDMAAVKPLLKDVKGEKAAIDTRKLQDREYAELRGVINARSSTRTSRNHAPRPTKAACRQSHGRRSARMREAS